MKTIPAPYRHISDHESLDVTGLAPTEIMFTVMGYSMFSMGMQHTHGYDMPDVKPIIRKIMKARSLNVLELRSITTDILNLFQCNGRNSIAICQAIFRVGRQIREDPWLYPFCLDDDELEYFLNGFRESARHADRAIAGSTGLGFLAAGAPALALWMAFTGTIGTQLSAYVDSYLKLYEEEFQKRSQYKSMTGI